MRTANVSIETILWKDGKMSSSHCAASVFTSDEQQANTHLSKLTSCAVEPFSRGVVCVVIEGVTGDSSNQPVDMMVSLLKLAASNGIAL